MHKRPEIGIFRHFGSASNAEQTAVENPVPSPGERALTPVEDLVSVGFSPE